MLHLHFRNRILRERHNSVSRDRSSVYRYQRQACGVDQRSHARSSRLTVWAILANALFLQPSITKGDTSRLDRNKANEAKTFAAAESVTAVLPLQHLPKLIGMLATDPEALAQKRRIRMQVAWAG